MAAKKENLDKEVHKRGLDCVKILARKPNFTQNPAFAKVLGSTRYYYKSKISPPTLKYQPSPSPM